jgi:hypothetical protein
VGSVISRSAAEAIIAPHNDVIGECLYNAWDHWCSTSLPTSVRPGTRASLVYDYAVAEAWRLLPGRSGISLTEQRRFLCVTIDDALLLRFKKFRRGLVTSGIPTGQQQLFAYQQLSLDGMPPMTNIVAGYLLDDFQREIARAAITCSVGNRRIWTIDLPRPGEGTVVQLAPAPRPVTPATVVRSAVKQDDVSEQKDL